MNQITIELGEIDNSCFVAMPFGSLFQIEYEKIIFPALEELNIKCVRGDEIYSKQRIVDDIWHSLKKCRFVLAELTGKNPNVLYEVGLAHAIGKPVIIITRNSDDVPFDLKALRYLYYDVNDPFWGNNLRIGIQNLAKKVIENPTIESYLEGISANAMNFPEIVEEKKLAKPNVKTSKIKGTWQGEFATTDKTVHKVTLQINQEKDFFSGAAVISYSKGEKHTVVQQIMNATMKKDEISLSGVNYTYIEQGDASGYSLDNFILKYNAAKDTLSGKVFSEFEDKSTLDVDIEFKRI